MQDASFAIDAHRDLGDDRALSLAAHFDTLTGASPNGAIAPRCATNIHQPVGPQHLFDSGRRDSARRHFPRHARGGRRRLEPAVRAALQVQCRPSASTEFDYQHFGAEPRDRAATSIAATPRCRRPSPMGWTPSNPSAAYRSPLATMPDAVGEEGAASESLRQQRQQERARFAAGRHAGSRPALRCCAINYSYSDSSGYLTDPYKVLSVVDPVTGELVARTPAPGATGLSASTASKAGRTRAGARACMPNTGTTSPSACCNSPTGIPPTTGQFDSSTLEARLRWPFGSSNYLEPHLRYYTQTAASFYRYSLVRGEPLPQFASADAGLGNSMPRPLGLKYGHTTADGNEWNARLELYRQSGKLPAAQLVGAQLDNRAASRFQRGDPASSDTGSSIEAGAILATHGACVSPRGWAV